MKEKHESIKEKLSNEVIELKKELEIKEKLISEMKIKLGRTQEWMKTAKTAENTLKGKSEKE